MIASMLCISACVLECKSGFVCVCVCVCVPVTQECLHMCF